MSDTGEFVHVSCAQCAGDCSDICTESGLPVSGGLMARPDQITAIRATRPLLRLQRQKRAQLHDLIDEAEKIGAWFYSESKRPLRPTPTYDRPSLPKFHEAKRLIKAEINRYYSPSRLRACLQSGWHPEDFYDFVWILVYPHEAVKGIQYIVGCINDEYQKFASDVLQATLKPE